MQRPQSVSGVAWRDVEEWVEELGKEHTVMAHFELRTQQKVLGGSLGLLVVLVVCGVQQSGKTGFTRRYKASWPTYSHKTMTGLMLFLVHQANEDLHHKPPIYRKQVKLLAYPQD